MIYKRSQPGETIPCATHIWYDRLGSVNISFATIHKIVIMTILVDIDVVTVVIIISSDQSTAVCALLLCSRRADPSQVNFLLVVALKAAILSCLYKQRLPL